MAVRNEFQGPKESIVEKYPSANSLVHNREWCLSGD